MNLARPPSSPSRWEWATAGLLLLGYWFVATASLADKCTTYDETSHLTAGCAYWQLNDYRLQPENGNLPQRWCALPIVLTGCARLPDRDDPAWRDSDVWALGRTFFHDEGNPLETMLFRGRGAAALLGVATALLVWLWSRTLWGAAGGLLSLAVCVLCPTMLAHGPLMTSDMCVTLFLLAGATTVWMVLHRLDWLRLGTCSLVLGCLFLSKASAVLILPTAAVLVGVRLLNRAPLTVAWGRKEWEVLSRGRQVLVFAASAAACIVVSMAVVWLAFGLRYSAFNTNVLPEGRFYTPGPSSDQEEPPSKARALIAALDQGRILPQAYLYGADYVVSHRNKPAFFRGEHSIDGWLWYFPFCFLVKTPWPLFALLALAAVALCIPRLRPPSASDSGRLSLWYRTAPLWALWGVYWIASLMSTLNIGHRHILPTYPPLYIAAGAAAGWLALTPGVGRSVLAGVLLWSAADTYTSFPNYLAYFNSLVPSDQAYQSLVDSNLDWGQDLPGLKRWLSIQGLEAEDAPPVYLAYFGSGKATYYGIHAQSLLDPRDNPGVGPPAEQLRGGTYCISATILQGVTLPYRGWNTTYENRYRYLYGYVQQLQKARNDPRALKTLLQGARAPDVQTVLRVYYAIRLARLCAFLRARKPDHEIGYSILIYRLSDEDIQRVMIPPAE